jgi:hypothetical protein
MSFFIGTLVLSTDPIKSSLKGGELPQKKNFFFCGGSLSGGWVGGVGDSETRSKPRTTGARCPDTRLVRLIYTYLVNERYFNESRARACYREGKQIWHIWKDVFD